MTDAEQVLMFNGINPPPPGKDRTTCPVCSPHRRKSHRPCLRVHIGAALVSWRCHHCDYFGSEAMQ